MICLGDGISEKPMDGELVQKRQDLAGLATFDFSPNWQTSAWMRLFPRSHPPFIILVFVLVGVCLGGLGPVHATPESTRPVVPVKNEQLWNVSVGMEQILMRQMTTVMRKTVPVTHEISGEQRFYQGMLDESFADSIASRGEMGIAQMVYDYLEQSQKVQKRGK